MKKYLFILAAVALCFTACKKNNDNKDNNKSTVGQDTEITINVPVSVVHNVGDVNWYANYATVDPAQVAKGLGISTEELFYALGTVNNEDTWQTGISSQEWDDTKTTIHVQYGIANKNDTMNGLDWTPCTSNNFGHWLTANGSKTYWSELSEDASENVYWYIENACWYWGKDLDDSATLEEYGYESKSDVLENMFTYAIGFNPTGLTNEGDSYKATEVLLYTDEEGGEHYVFIEFDVDITSFVDPEAGKYDSSKRQSGTFNKTYTETVSAASGYTGVYVDLTELQDILQMTKLEISSALTEGTLTAQGYVAGEAVDNNAGGFCGNWMDIDGNLTGWGASAILCVETSVDSDNFQTHICTYADADNVVSTAIGKSYTYKQVLTYLDTIINLNFNVTIAE